MTAENTLTVPSTATGLRLPVDPEHGMLRLLVIVSFVVSGLGTYLLLNTFVGDRIPFMNLISIGMAILMATFITRSVEAGMKRRWPSGRVFEIDGGKIRLKTGDEITREIDGEQHVNLLSWRFTINKRSRVPKGWYVVAVALMQDDLHLPIYAFMSPDDFEAMPHNEHFTVLTPQKESEKDKSNLRLAGQQRRLRTAEYARWNEGAEMTKEDFLMALSTLQTSFPAWTFSE